MSSASGSISSVTNDNNWTNENHFGWKYEKKCSVAWQISKDKVFSDSFRNEKPLESSTFGAADDDFKWRLECSVHREHHMSCGWTDFISLVLYPDRNTDFEKSGPVSGKTTFSVLDKSSENQNVKFGTKEASFKFESGIKRIQCCGFLKFMELRIARDFINDRFLDVVCDITYTKTDRTIRSTEILKSNLSLDMERLLMNEHFSDVSISVGEKIYPAHKNILSFRSSVFDAMFRNKMQESATNRITIKDMDEETIQEMLYFIYTGKTKTSRELALKLLPAADKYDLKALKVMCTEVLIKTLSKDNAIEVLLLADVSNADQLLKDTLEFIKDCIAENADFKTEVWKILTETHPHLMKNLLAVYFSSSEGRSKSL